MILSDDNEKQAVARRAREIFLTSGFNCAESVLLANMERLGVEGEWLPRVASGFGGGIARTGQVCGALTGAVMALGWAMGRSAPDDSIDELYGEVAGLVDEFTSEFGTTSCRMLIDIDLSDPEEHKRAQKTGIFEQQCARYVEFCAARVAEKLPGTQG
jgi:C_GCAxxG_C_C family probable redox protein